MPSAAKAIRDAAVTKLLTLTLDGSPAVVARKVPALPAGKYPPAVVVATGSAGGIEPLDQGTGAGTRVLVAYPLTVALFAATDGTATDGERLDLWRQTIGRALDDRAVFAAAGDVNEVYRTDDAVFDPAGLDEMYNTAFLRFTVELIEPRN